LLEMGTHVYAWVSLGLLRPHKASVRGQQQSRQRLPVRLRAKGACQLALPDCPASHFRDGSGVYGRPSLRNTSTRNRKQEGFVMSTLQAMWLGALLAWTPSLLVMILLFWPKRTQHQRGPWDR
jgi:hypothetical protein